MTEKIFYYNDSESAFDNLSLGNPNRLPGGAYFSKLSNEEERFIFQTPKCITKSGLITTAKKTYCDLLLTSENQIFIEWVEKLEQAIQYLIYSKRNLWFHNDMELEDIEFFFIPTLRLYKKNKYLLRCYVQQPKHIKKSSALQIYDENENNLDMGDIEKDQPIISILEVLGIKFTSQSFHIEYCLRQVMVINEKPLFSRCLITSKKFKGEKPEKPLEESLEKIESLEEVQKPLEEIEKPMEEVEKPVEEVEKPVEEVEKSLEEVEKPLEEVEKPLEEVKIENTSSAEESLEDKVLEKFTKHLEKNDELKEIDVGLMDETEPMKLKKPTEVYYEIYRKARKKAREAKKKAISAYLEAKRIKNTYLSDEIVSSDESDSLTELNDCEATF